MLSDERDLTHIDRLRIGSLHVEPPFADEDLLHEITELESEVERLRTELATAMECVAVTAGQNDHLRARVARLVGVLRDVEWEGQMDEDDLYYPVATCPNCDGWQKQGHAPDCALDAALRDAHE
jgi:hypothetical protein